MEILGIKINSGERRDIVQLISNYIEGVEKRHIVTVNPEYVVEAQRNVVFKNVLNRADLSLIDGTGILVGLDYLYLHTKVNSTFSSYWHLFQSLVRVGFSASRIKIQAFTFEKITGVDLIWLLVQQDWMKGRRIYLVGGKENVASSAVRRLQHTNPDIQFRSSNGISDIKNIDQQENDALLADISSFNPDVLLVAFGHPYQDIWTDEYKDRMRFKIAVGVGGSFDYIAGRVTRAPGWMRALGLEWLYRLFKQPKRFKRIVTATWTYCRLLLQS